jgi:hypothetical protein
MTPYLTSLLSKFILEFATRMVRDNTAELELNDILQSGVCKLGYFVRINFKYLKQQHWNLKRNPPVPEVWILHSTSLYLDFNDSFVINFNVIFIIWYI